ncbi:unnamed protein product [Rhizoctonia solani]|uniref:Uncharacterized protein n=1 Tax=Rhizoctonia solani TaxID=456999 RepID=A0A8H2Y0L8_9AGAM|nr:unnamed protein product [Rhizoctonia solani]CAE6442841.1 unnamed protein product [Rhizoctonia solani]
MSQHVAHPADDPAQEPTSQSPTNHLSNTPDQVLPPFQPFPARSRPIHSGSSSFVPQNRFCDAELGLVSGSDTVTNDPYQLQTRGGLNTRASRHAAEGSMPMQGRHPSALPAFTPFPAAAPSSRYAPPPNSRAEPTRPVLPPIVYSEDVSSGPWVSERPANLVGESSTPIIRYPSGIPPGRPSPFAPPGPLTARPHKPTRASDLTNALTAKDRLAGRMLYDYASLPY